MGGIWQGGQQFVRGAAVSSWGDWTYGRPGARHGRLPPQRPAPDKGTGVFPVHCSSFTVHMDNDINGLIKQDASTVFEKGILSIYVCPGRG